jgi:hypothetical protein
MANHTKTTRFIALSPGLGFFAAALPCCDLCDPLDSWFASECCKLVVAADLPGSASHSLEEYCV